MGRYVPQIRRKATTRQHDPASYRQAMPVTAMRIYRGGDGYYVCPRCGVSLEREFMAYCDRCGQCLGWEQHHRAYRTG
ncbi:MAG: hypothetical protein LUJ09_07490 [Firmicutes bacterium]|nr:hypothetical protein [Bacillota bacterium]